MPTVEQVKCLTNGPLAQLAEQRTLNPEVQGSIPWWPTTFEYNSALEETTPWGLFFGKII